MICPGGSFQLKNGMICALRSPVCTEAAQRLAFFRQANGETDGLSRGAADSPEDVALAAEMIDDIALSDADLEIAAWLNGRMIACGSIAPVSAGQTRRRHRARLGVVVLREYWSQGLGRELVRRMLMAAPDMGYSQTELTVAADNVRAIRLYRRMGFEETGRIPRALRLEDGRTVDEIMMVRVFQGSDEI